MCGIVKKPTHKQQKSKRQKYCILKKICAIGFYFDTNIKARTGKLNSNGTYNQSIFKTNFL